MQGLPAIYLPEILRISINFIFIAKDQRIILHLLSF